ncbi:environmental stress-induced protein Ves [Cryobacterium sp. MP_M5]|uniref:HutD/Ves family protein n=1 Tax=unclassified Cryobacterium TaxID=2649013 RepID=UPI0018CA3579|nr:MULTISPECIES: HutD family protein [unclassified Cryobacterium]MBG6059373.1 environmental stress-induced protein Ves [Cryobacterium sp. MP_M3]MEC5177648.1 environmental stress-induced protein Ves [Cryobacterium sp. MP_M5]
MSDGGPVLLPVAGRVRAAWRNGGGTTAEVIVRGDHRSPGADPGFDWRVSIATVERDGDFSPYPGVDRWLMPLSADGLRLVEEGELVPVGQHEVRAFPGERAVTSLGVTEPTLDLNLMVRRGGTTGSLCAAEVAGRAELTTAAGEELVILVLHGVVDAALDTVPGGTPPGASTRTLARHDAVYLGAGRQLTLHGVGGIAVARITMAPGDEPVAAGAI